MSNRQVRRFGQLSLVALLALVAAAAGQLSFHNDPSQNSFSIKLPSFQQSFTRYFGNQPQGALLQQQQQQQQQQQIPSTLSHPSLIGTQAQAYQQQQQQQQQPIYYQPQAQQQPQHESLNRYVAQFPDQPHYTVQENYINPNIRMRLQQQRLLQQQQQQQQQQYAAPQPNKYATFTSFGAQPTAPDATVYAGNNQQQPQYEYVQQTGEGQQEQTQYQQQQPSYSVRGQQAPQPGTETDASTNAAKLIGVAFSPSNEVSQVKFSSAGLKYNF
uniref:ras-interacting protein RIP3 isoform X1 n=1 Tax=Anopheles coluzzii TaxID=1518534 RepID=UPI0020FFD049|nr:ras-interacting protein RIP3 isoform X1 [Anopheles coluzzii]